MGIYVKSKKAPSFVFGSGPKTARDLTSRRLVPGPGAYDYKLLGKSVTGISFTHDKKSREYKNDVPGPGSYKVPVKIADVPRYLIPKQDETFKYV